MSSYASTSGESGDLASVLRGFTAGSLAVVVSKTATAPAERVKLILQLQNSHQAGCCSLATSTATNAAAGRNYAGIFDCFRRVCAEQGVRSLWRGNWATVARSFPTHALNFVLRDHYRLLFLRNVDKRTHYGRFVLGNIAAGAAGSMTSLCLVYPLDLARTRLAVETNKDGSPKFRGIYDCLRTITRREGPKGAYRGFCMSLQHVTLQGAVFFGMFDTLRCTLADDTRQLGFFTVWLIAQVCVVSSGLITYPLDTIRRKLALESGRQVKTYNGSVDCLAKILKSEGASALYRGALLNSMKSMSGAIMLATYYCI